MQFYRKQQRKHTIYPFYRALFTLALCWCFFLSFVGFTAKAAPFTTQGFAVVFSTKNFSSQLVSATSGDTSSPGHFSFTLQNGSPLWYGVSMQASPTGLTLAPTNPSGDLVTSTFFANTLLLPPAHILPMDQWNGTFHFETLHLAATFTDKGQQIQLELLPSETHAVTLDALTLILQLLGQRNEGAQIGLLGPGALKDVFDTTNNMKDFSALVTNYEQVLQAVPNATTTLSYAYACSLNLTALLSDTSEQNMLADLLWKIQGKVITRADILKAIIGLSQTQFGLASEAFINNQALAVGGALLQQAAPTILLQAVDATTANPTAAHTSTPTHAPTLTPTLTPTQTQSPNQAVTPTPHLIPTATPTLRPTATPTPPRLRPSATPTPRPTATRTPQPTVTQTNQQETPTVRAGRETRSHVMLKNSVIANATLP